MKDDAELQKIEKMDGLSELKDSFKQKLGEVAEALRINMKERCEVIENERASYLGALGAVYTDSQAWSIDRLKTLSRAHKKFFTDALQCTLPPRVQFVGKTVPNMQDVERKSRDLKSEIARACSELEEREMESQGQAFKLIDTFEDVYALQMTSLTEVMQEFFQAAINLENKFHEELKNLAVAAVELFADEQANAALESENKERDNQNSDGSDADEALSDEEETVDEYTQLLSSLDSMIEVVNGSHEKHESIILNLDDVVRTTIKQNLLSDLAKYKNKEFSRGREVITDSMKVCTELDESATKATEVVRQISDDN